MANKEIKYLGHQSKEALQNTTESIIDRWDKLGFTQGLKGDALEYVSKTMENMAQYLLYGDHNLEVTDMLEVGLFVLIRKAMTGMDGNAIVKRVVPAEEFIDILTSNNLYDLQSFLEDTAENEHEQKVARILWKFIELNGISTNKLMYLLELKNDWLTDDETLRSALIICYVMDLDIEAEVQCLLHGFVRNKLVCNTEG